jgi:hypothetical protein
VPSRPQVEAGLCGQVAAEAGATPAGTNEQTPGAAGVLHDLQVSLQALSQQIPSTQNPLPQSAAHPQAAPLARWAPPSAPQVAPSCPAFGFGVPPPPCPLQPATANAAPRSATSSGSWGRRCITTSSTPRRPEYSGPPATFETIPDPV